MCLERMGSFLHISTEDAQKIIDKAKAGQEINETFSSSEWIEQRLIPNCVFINQNEYAEMCVDALKILSTTAATDYGSSRQRDLGQLWADMTRGYLGEIAFVKFLKEKHNIDARLGHDIGTLSDYLPSDIHEIKKGNEYFRSPRIEISIKTSKWNGIWLDIPGDQFNHSYVHVFIKIGAGRDHLFAFFKEISVFKDKVLRKGVEVGSLSETEADQLYDNLPSFTPIPAYICGFVLRDTPYSTLDYSGKKGKKHYTIKSWNGSIRPNDLSEIKDREKVDGNVNFEGIGTFAHDSGYLFNTGNLLWQHTDWQRVIDAL
ncbi:MAG: hypothetical protein AB1454_07975 [Candidatus Auribacterota bacterium]